LDVTLVFRIVKERNVLNHFIIDEIIGYSQMIKSVVLVSEYV